MTINTVLNSTLHSTVPITAGYAESEVFYSSMVWYDRAAAHAGMKRSHHSLDAYSLMDPCGYYSHLQPPSLKYMKPEPMPYYYPEDPERYQANITVSVQSQPMHSYGASSSNALQASYNPMPQFSYSSSVLGSMSAATDNTGAYSLGGYNLAAMPTQHSAVYPRNVSPERSSTATVAEEPASMSTPLTPPLSVSPVPGAHGSPPPPHTTASLMTSSSNTYTDKDSAVIGYRSASSSPCMQASCDTTSTNQSELLSEKLPLHVLSDLSEGLPLPGM